MSFLGTGRSVLVNCVVGNGLDADRTTTVNSKDREPCQSRLLNELLCRKK